MIEKTEESGDDGIPSSVATADEAAKMLNINRDTIMKAKTVLKEGTADEISAVEAGTATLSRGDVASQRIEKTDESSGVEITTPSKTGEEAAAMLNVHRATVICAKTVLKDGTAEEIAAVEAGTAAVTTKVPVNVTYVQGLRSENGSSWRVGTTIADVLHSVSPFIPAAASGNKSTQLM